MESRNNSLPLKAPIKHFDSKKNKRLSITRKGNTIEKKSTEKFEKNIKVDRDVRKMVPLKLIRRCNGPLCSLKQNSDDHDEEKMIDSDRHIFKQINEFIEFKFADECVTKEQDDPKIVQDDPKIVLQDDPKIVLQDEQINK